MRAIFFLEKSSNIGVIVDELVSSNVRKEDSATESDLFDFDSMREEEAESETIEQAESAGSGIDSESESKTAGKQFTISHQPTVKETVKSVIIM